MSRIVTSANNPLLASQWHLGQIFKGDPNRIWSEFSGAGVKVGVYDDGIDKSHIDLRNRYDSSRELVINGQRLDASTGSAVHGTAVAGLIAADANNGAGGVGVAHSAMLTGVNIFSGIGASSGFINAIRGMSSFDVTNNSWGWSSRYADSAHQSGSFGNLFAAAVKNAADTGRGGLGTIVVNAAGNEGGEGRDANMSNFNAMRQTITVGAIGQDGDVSGYATRGASVLVSGPSSGGGAGIVTTDASGSRGYASGDYTSGFSGTSAASPIVSGVVAVMLSANSKLGWRDVQDILAITADHTTPASLSGGVSGRMQSGWTVNKADNVNGGGLHYSNDVGFGRVDALEAVRFADVWSRFGNAQTSANEQVATVSGTLNRAIADLRSTEFTVNIARAIEVESVSLTLTLSHGNINDLRVELISPEGTRSVVLNAAPGSQSVSGFTWSFTSEALRGELASGNWLVRITDTRAGATGSVASYRFDVYGDAISANDVYHYTSEFGKMLALDAARGTLRDTDGGIDWINASATIDATIINLNAGALSTIHGRSLTIAAGTVIENAVTGDGNDMLTGNDAANTLLGMRGNDTLEGRGGADRLEGGAGIDTASYLGSNLGIDIDLTRATQTGGHAQGDVLVGIENVTGSAHNDRISGDGNANMLAGGFGNDTLNGGEGSDTVVFTGSRNQYRIGSNTADGVIIRDSISDRDGNDLLQNIEWLNFTDKTVVSPSSLNPIGVAIADQLSVVYFGRGISFDWRNLTATVVADGASPGILTAFYNAAVADRAFGASDSLQTIVNKTFNNIFGVDASAFEQNAWAATVDAGAVSREALPWQMFNSYLGATNMPVSYQVPAQSRIIAVNAFTNAVQGDNEAALGNAGALSAESAREWLRPIRSQSDAGAKVLSAEQDVGSIAISTVGGFASTVDFFV